MLMNRITNIFTSTHFLAFVISIIVVIFLPPIFNKYNAEIIRSWTIDKENGLIINMNYLSLVNRKSKKVILLNGIQEIEFAISAKRLKVLGEISG